MVVFGGTIMNVRKLFKNKILKKRKKIKGFLDGIDGQYVFGWAWDRENPEKRLEVVVYVDGEPVAEGVADIYREDLEKEGIGDGRYGFRVKLPEDSIKRPICEISVKIKSENLELQNSPCNAYFTDFLNYDSAPTDLKSEIDLIVSFFKNIKYGVDLFHIVLPLDEKDNIDDKMYFRINNTLEKINTFFQTSNRIIIPIPSIFWKTFNNEGSEIQIIVGEDIKQFFVTLTDVIKWFETIFTKDFKNISYANYLKQYLSLHAIEAYSNSSLIRKIVNSKENLKLEVEKCINVMELYKLSDEDYEELSNLLINYKFDKKAFLFNDIYKRIIKQMTENEAEKFLEPLYENKSIPEEVRRGFIYAFIPKLALNKKSFPLNLKDIQSLKNSKHKWNIGITLPYINEIDELKDLFYELAKKEIPGWIPTECVYATVEKISENVENLFVKELNDFVYSYISLIDSHNTEDRWYSRVYDKYLVSSAKALLKICPFLYEWTRRDLVNCIIRNYGLNIDFWQNVDEDYFRAIPILEKAKGLFSLIQSLLENGQLSKDNFNEVINALEFFLSFNNKDGLFLMREVGYLCLLKEMDNEAKFVFEKTEMIAKGDILRYYAHPFSNPEITPYEEIRIKNTIRELIPELPKSSMINTEEKLGKALLSNDRNSNSMISIISFMLKNAQETSFIAYPFAVEFWDNFGITILEELSKFLENNKELSPSIEATLLRLKLLYNFTEYNFLIEDILKKVDNFEWLNLKPDNYFHKDDYNPFFNDTIFIIYSCQKNLNTRIKEIRNTYIKDLKLLKIPYIIIVGGSDRDYIEDDVLYLNVPDAYEDLPKKTIKFLKWLYENTSFYYFYKIDDDSYIDIEKFLSTLQYRKFHYYGKKIKKFLQLDRTWHRGKSKNEIISLTLDKSYSNMSWADGGSGYSLTRFAINKILKTLEKDNGKFLYKFYLYEDMLIGTLLGINDIVCNETEYYVSKQFRTSADASPVHVWHNYFYPSKINPIVYVHLDTEKNLKKAHEIKEKQKLYPYKVWSSSVNIKLDENSNQLELLSDKAKLNLLNKEPIVIVPVRNERKMLPHFLGYYRKLGVESFVFIDNLSDDGTREYLLEQPDVVVFSVDTEYKASHYGICWQHAVLSNFCIGKWVLLIDADEFLVYENCEEVNIKDFLNNVESIGFKGVRADLIDVYPKKLELLDLAKNSPFEVNIFFDREPLIPIIFGGGLYSNCHLAFSSNLRHRISPDTLIDDFTNVKYPIFKYYPWIRFSEGIHFVSPYENFLEGEAFLLHFKYHSDFKKKVVTEVLRKQHFENAREYIRYYIALERNKGDLYDENISLKYENSKQFIKYLRRFYKR